MAAAGGRLLFSGGAPTLTWSVSRLSTHLKSGIRHPAVLHRHPNRSGCTVVPSPLRIAVCCAGAARAGSGENRRGFFRGGVERAVTGGAAARASEHDIHGCAFFKLLLCFFVSNLELLPFCFTPFCSVVEL